MHNIIGSPRWCLCLLLAWHTLAIEPSHTAAWTTYETPIGGSARVVLNNGSTVQLNTNTKLQTQVVGIDRTVTIDRGEAFFHVGSSALQVVVHDVSIGATDTSFSVRDYGDGNVDIMSVDGLIHIAPVRAKYGYTALSTDRSDQVASAGQLATIRAGIVSLRSLGRSSIQRKLMWRYGMLEFANATIESAAAEFNRYNRTRVIVDDPMVGCGRIGGRFSATDIEVFVATLRRVFEMRARTSQTSAGAVIHLQRMSGGGNVNNSPCTPKSISDQRE